MTGRLFVISAPSGAGKTTLCQRLLREHPALEYSVSHTTRAPRPGEIDGRDYNFTTPEQFRRMIAADGFLEWAEVFGRLYGTGRAWVMERLNRGLNVLVDVDVAGARRIRHNFPEAVLIFILPPTFAELTARLKKRGTETEKDLAVRLGRVREEIGQKDLYDYLVINDQVERALGDLAAIIRAETLRLSQAEDFRPAFFGVE
ncbi:MAG: guanylate kinase [Pseudomonadota bacterium]